MGAYLSQPDKATHSVDDESTRFKYGASSMQGWRISNEDAHSCILDYDKGSALFAVYDGHGGPEVAIYTAENLPLYIKSHELYLQGDIEKALQESFVEFDFSLKDSVVAQKLAEIAEKQATMSDNDEQPGTSDPGPSGSKVNGRSSIVEDVDTSVLKQEAELPIEELLRKYVRDNKNTSKMLPLFKNIIAKKLVPNSPMIKSAQTQKGNTSSSSSKSNVCSFSNVDGDTTQENYVEVTSGCSSETANQQDSSTTSKSNKISSDEPSGSSSSKKESVQDEEMAGESSDSKPVEGPSSSFTSTDHAESTRLALSLLMSSDDDDDSSEGSDFDSEDLESSNDDDDDDDDDDDGDDEDDDDIENMFEAARHRLRKFKRKGADTNRDSDDDEQEEEGEEDEEDQWEDQEEESEEGDPSKYTATPGKDSGCTAVVALFRGNTLYVANAGDSRCVVCRDGNALEMSQDHKPEDKIESDRIREAGGKITEDGRVNGGLNLSRAIGDYSYKCNEKLSYREQMITALPDVKKCEIDPKTDSFVVLACDGIWNSMTSQEVVDFIKARIDKTEKLSTICEEIFHHCLAEDTSGDGTGCDNMTCIIIRIDENTIHKEDDLVPDRQTIVKENAKRKCDEESELPKKKECVEEGTQDVVV